MIRKQLFILISGLIFLTLIAILTVQASTIPKYKISQNDLPDLEKLEDAVLKHAGLDPTQIKRWEKGAKWSAALPRIQVGWDSKFINQNTTVSQDTISVTSSGVTIGPESNRLDLDIENNQDFEVKAVWSLDELLFNRNQLDVSREARDLFFVRSRLTQELHQAYYELKSFLMGFQLDSEQEFGPLEQLKLEQLINKLNSMTGGEFKRLLREKLKVQSALNNSGAADETK